MSFNPSSRRISIPRGGRIDSQKLLTLFDQVVDDFVSVAEDSADLHSSVLNQALASQAEDRELRQRIAQLESDIESLRVRDAEDSLDLVYNVSMFDSTRHDFLSTSLAANRPAINTLYGEATVPINAADSRLFQQAVNTGSVIPIEDLSVTVTGTFDAGDGNGVTNHETGGTVYDDSSLNAFNGNNTSRWIRKVSYPLYSDVTEVMCEVTVDVPAGSGAESNVVYVHPAPAGDVDILGVYVASDLSGSFTLVPGFAEKNGAGPTRYIFPVRYVQRVKVRFRQRNWIEEDGKKVFRYGAQEIGLQLLEWDKTYSSSDPLNENHTLVLKQDAPDGYGFNRLKSVTTDPLFTLEDSGKRHVHIKACEDAAGTTVIWDSDVDALPQSGAGFTPSSTIETIYFMVTLNYVATTGGSTSPFPVGTTPIFKSLTFQATVETV